MQTADHRKGHDLSPRRPLLLSAVRRVFIEAEITAGLVVVAHLLTKQPTQVTRTQHDDVVEQLSTERADEALHVRVLPWGPRGRLDLFDTERPNSITEGSTVDTVAVPQIGVGAGSLSASATPDR